MDSEYLENTLGKDLTDCLTEVCLKRPSDPIEYIALWLYKRDRILKLEAEEAKQKAELQALLLERQLEIERLEKLYLENLRLEEEEKERLRQIEMEAERLRLLELKRKEAEVQPVERVSKIEQVSESSMIEIGIKTHGSSSDKSNATSDKNISE